MSQKPKRRHHTVPQFHLRRFANEQGHLIRVELPGSKRDRVSVRDATVEKYFYSRELPDGSWTASAEDRLAEIETRAADALRDLLDAESWPIPPDTREGIASWAALQFLRTPANRQALNELADFALKLEIAVGGRARLRQVLEEIDGGQVGDKDVGDWWTEMRQFDTYQLVNHPNFHIQHIGRLLPATFTQFLRRGWNFVRFNRKAMITTDTPVVLLHGPGQDHGLPAGLATAGGILVPLDRRAALVMAEPGGQDYQIAGTTSLSKTLNQLLADDARRAVFHHPDDDPLQGLTLPEPREREVQAPDPAAFIHEPPVGE
jgi:hypothetical protein